MSALLLTMLDFWTFLKVLESALWDLLKPQETEFCKPKELLWHSINWLNLPQLERESFSLEAQEIEKQNVISVSVQVKRDHTLLLALDQ